MDYNYYNIFNEISKLQQQSKEQESKLNEMKLYYENKLNEMKDHYENKIKEYEVKTSEQTYILEPNFKNYMIHMNKIDKKLCFDREQLQCLKYKKQDGEGIFTVEPLVLTIKNNVCHLYGMIFGNIDYNMPSHINIDSKNPRLLHKYYIHNDTTFYVLLHDNLFRLHYEKYSNGLSPAYQTYQPINIHFDL